MAAQKRGNRQQTCCYGDARWLKAQQKRQTIPQEKVDLKRQNVRQSQTINGHSVMIYKFSSTYIYIYAKYINYGHNSQFYSKDYSSKSHPKGHISQPQPKGHGSKSHSKGHTSKYHFTCPLLKSHLNGHAFKSHSKGLKATLPNLTKSHLKVHFQI